MSTVSFIRRMLDMGFSHDDALRAAEAFEAEREPPQKTRSAGAIRQARYAERVRQKASESVIPDASDAPDAPSLSRPLPPQTPPTPTHTHGDISTREREATATRGQFALFWMAYPSKVGKRDAEKAYDRALRRISDPDPPGVILAGVERAKLSRRWREGFIPNPSTWLNQDRWEDQEPEQNNGHERTDQSRPSPRDQRLQRMLAGAMAASDD